MESCCNCRFSVKVEDKDCDTLYECHRNAIQIVGFDEDCCLVSAFPVCETDSWCGEYEAYRREKYGGYYDILQFRGDAMTNRIYVSGPVTGIPNRNQETFERVASVLEGHGYSTCVPTRFVPPNASRGEIMRTCMSEMLRCSGVCVLDGWMDSAGSRLEVEVARECGLVVTELDEWVRHGYVFE